MRSRVRKYVAVVMTLLLCMGLWFGHGETVKAEIPATGALYVYIMGMSEDGLQTVANKIEIGEVTIDNFAGSEAEGYSGTISLTEEQTKGADIYSGYLLYWYKMQDNMLQLVAEGCTPTIDINDLENVVVEPVADEEGNITSYTVTGFIYAEHGASNIATYISNYDMSGDSTDSVSVPYFQKDTTVTEAAYSHPVEPTFGSETNQVIWTKEGYLFAGWGTTDSGGVNAPESFKYAEKTQTETTFYAQWKEAAILDAYYYEDEMSDEAAITATITQSNASDTEFYFVTAEAPERDNSFFTGWKYYVGEDYTEEKTIGASTECREIAIPEFETYKTINFYGTWKDVANLTLNYYATDADTEVYAQEVITQENVDDTVFTFTAPEAPERDGYIFTGWVYTDEVGGKTLVDPGATCTSIEIDEALDEYPNFSRDFYGTWKEALPAGSTVSAGTSTLQADTPYVLGGGSWTVTYGSAIDSSVYAGGETFYVSTPGDYTFTAN